MLKILILFFLIIGVSFRLYLTANNNFLFNMDNARDFVDVREIVVLHKARLIGPTSAIEGVYNGPAWYYLLAVPFVLTNGNPYGAILMEIFLWVIGGFFLFKLCKNYGYLILSFVGFVWVYSNYIVLTNLYSFNPNPVTLLSPLFIYLLKRYLETNKLIFSISVFLLGGLFFNFEMNFGIFVLPIIFLSVILSQKTNFLKTKIFWIGFSFFILTLLPQLFFDLRHNFIMTNSLLRFIATPSTPGKLFNLTIQITSTFEKFFNVFAPTFFNLQLLTKILIFLFIISLFKFLKTSSLKKDLTILISILMIVVPFLGYIILPVSVNSWHLGAETVAFIILSAFTLNQFRNWSLLGKIISYSICFFIIFYVLWDFTNSFSLHKPKSMDVSNIDNEIAAVDYVFQKAEGKNFKVYIYLPSIMDYPYQYLFWWRGLEKYGYVPKDYAYLPGMPPYISNKEKLPMGSNPPDSNLIFLIKEPDRIKIRHLWENSFTKYPLIKSEWVGPILIETRKEI
ncbi:MAG: hypothetical protein Q7R43_06865 [Candidatus Daviesbacteria bacterium]|nr:hypothetical protein [Candidatus Daviesbacteria bacterium]